MRGGIDPDLLREMRHFLQTVRVSLEDGDRTVALIRPADTRAVTGLLGVLDDLERREVVDPDGPAGPILLWGTWGGGPGRAGARRVPVAGRRRERGGSGMSSAEPAAVGDQKPRNPWWCCQVCLGEIGDDPPLCLNGALLGHWVYFCSWECFKRYEPGMNEREPVWAQAGWSITGDGRLLGS